MKKTIIYSALFVTTLSMSSCGDDFLLLDPVGAVSENTMTNDKGIDYVLTAAYNSLGGNTNMANNGSGSIADHIFGDVVAGDANKGSQSTDQSNWTQLETYQFDASNGYLRTKWMAVYEAVKRCNTVLDLCEKAAAATGGDYSLQIAQAKIIKGFWMFEGVKMFGAAIPYVTLEDYQASTDPMVSNVDENGSYVYIWNNIEQDLKDAISGLPDTWDAANMGRLNKWAAKALLAKVYLFWSSPYNGTNATADHWADAKALIEDVMNNGKTNAGNKFALIDSYKSIFQDPNIDHSCEMVMEAEQSLSGTAVYTNTLLGNSRYAGMTSALGLGGFGFYQPNSEFVNNYIVDENGLPLSKSAYRSLVALSHVEEGLVVSDLNTATDPRLDIVVGRMGVPYLDYGSMTNSNFGAWVRDLANGGVYTHKKRIPNKADRGSTALTTDAVTSARNFPLIRTAELYLWYAECCLHDHDVTTAIEYINKVRARAANDYVEAKDGITEGSYTLDDKVNGKTVSGTAANYRIGLYSNSMSESEAIEVLRREMRLELGLEGRRWFDLARWGIIADEINAFQAYEVQYLPKYVNPYNENWVTYPIPLTEIQTAEGRFVQNENWK